jgi:hypothetical protein
VAKTLQAKLRELTPKNDLQKIASRASLADLQRCVASPPTLNGRAAEYPPDSIPRVAHLLAHGSISFGLLAPRNGTVLAVLLICALSVSSAIFLVLEMDRPLDGFIKASNAPLRKAVELIGK